jgi:hypothetical protein
MFYVVICVCAADYRRYGWRRWESCCSCWSAPTSPTLRPRGSSTVSHQRSVSILSRESVLWIRIHLIRIRFGSSISIGAGSAPLGLFTVYRQRSASSPYTFCRESVLWIRIQHFKWIRIHHFEWIQDPHPRGSSTVSHQRSVSILTLHQCCGSGSAPPGVVYCLPPEVSQHPHLTPVLRIRIQHFKWIRICAPGCHSLSPTRGQHP